MRITTAQPVIKVGTVTTLAAGVPATASFTGTALNLGIPAGAAGSSAAATPLASTLPAALGTAAIGVSTTAARSDHVHALPISSSLPLSPGTASAGASSTFSRDDHRHPAPSGVNTLVGTVALSQTAIIAIALGIREVTAGLSGAVVGGRYIAFAVSYQLNGGSVTNGRPPGYAILDCVCNSANTITVSLNAPLLAVGQSYIINCQIVSVGV